MMNHEIDKTGVIDKEKLAGESYFKSLLEQGYSKGAFLEGDIERLQYECLELLASKVKRFNSGDSSSIRVENAQSIMDSNLFTIGLRLKFYQNPDDAVAALKNENITEIYQKGRIRIDEMLSASKKLYYNLLSRLVDTKNVFYRATIVSGIKGFFKIYYPDFGAHEIHITADYPAFNPAPRLAGIEFIQVYLEALFYENQFCLNFDPDDIHHLLCGCEENYQALLMNIYEPVLTMSIGCILAGTDVYKLDMTEDGISYVNSLFTGKSKSDILSIIQNAASELSKIFKFSLGLERYIKNSLPLVSSKIGIAARENALNHVLITPAYPEQRPRLYFSFGTKIENEQYRKAVNEMMQCRFLPDKIAIIHEQIHSLADFKDVLLDAFLTHDEIMTVLHELRLPEIAALAKKYMLWNELDASMHREQDRVLQSCLNDFISALPPDQQELIKNTSEKLEEVL